MNGMLSDKKTENTEGINDFCKTRDDVNNASFLSPIEKLISVAMGFTIDTTEFFSNFVLNTASLTANPWNLYISSIFIFSVISYLLYQAYKGAGFKHSLCLFFTLALILKMAFSIFACEVIASKTYYLSKERTDTSSQPLGVNFFHLYPVQAILLEFLGLSILTCLFRNASPSMKYGSDLMGFVFKIDLTLIFQTVLTCILLLCSEPPTKPYVNHQTSTGQLLLILLVIFSFFFMYTYFNKYQRLYETALEAYNRAIENTKKQQGEGSSVFDEFPENIINKFVGDNQ